MRGKKLTAREQEEFAMLHDDACANKFLLMDYFQIGKSYTEKLIRDLPTRKLYGLASPAHPLHIDRVYKKAMKAQTPVLDIEQLEQWALTHDVPVIDITQSRTDVSFILRNLKGVNRLLQALNLPDDPDPDSTTQQLLACVKVRCEVLDVTFGDEGSVTSGRFRLTVQMPRNLVTSLVS